MCFIQFLNLFCYRTQMVWTSITSSHKTQMRWRPFQIKAMDFSVRNSACTNSNFLCYINVLVIILFSFYRLTEAPPHSPFAPSVPFRVDEWANQTEAWCHTKECHMGRSLFFNDLLRYLCNCDILWFIQVFSCFFRTSWGSVWNHGRRFHEACGRHCRSAFGCRGQCYHLQWPAGSHCGHNGWGCEPFQNGNSWPTHFRL